MFGFEENVVIHCETRELSNQVLDIALDKGFFYSGVLHIKDLWEISKSSTCYHFDTKNNSINHTYKEHAIACRYKITKAKDFIDHYTVPEKNAYTLENRNKIPQRVWLTFRSKEGQTWICCWGLCLYHISETNEITFYPYWRDNFFLYASGCWYSVKYSTRKEAYIVEQALEKYQKETSESTALDNSVEQSKTKKEDATICKVQIKNFKIRSRQIKGSVIASRSKS